MHRLSGAVSPQSCPEEAVVTLGVETAGLYRLLGEGYLVGDR